MKHHATLTMILIDWKIANPFIQNYHWLHIESDRMVLALPLVFSCVHTSQSCRHGVQAFRSLRPFAATPASLANSKFSSVLNPRNVRCAAGCDPAWHSFWHRSWQLQASTAALPLRTPGIPVLRLRPGRSGLVRAAWGADVEFHPAKVTSNKEEALKVVGLEDWNGVRASLRVRLGIPLDIIYSSAGCKTSRPSIPRSQQHRLVIEVGKLAAEYSTPGQFVQAKRRAEDKAGFFAIASPPDLDSGRLELLLKASGATAEDLCALKPGAGLWRLVPFLHAPRHGRLFAGAGV